MTATEPITDFLITVDPDLDYGPDWMPPPDPPVNLGPLNEKIHWSSVFDWVKSGYNYVFFGGTPIDTVTTQQVQTAVDAAVGQVVKAISGFINQTAAMAIQGVSMLENAIAMQAQITTTNFDFEQEEIHTLQNVQAVFANWVVPGLEAQIKVATADGFAFALAAQANAEAYARKAVFVPLYTELLKVGPVIDAKIAANNVIQQQHTLSVVDALKATLLPVVASLGTKVASLVAESENCVQDMCQTMGPKTDLGKLLKALSLTLDAAALADLLSLTEPELVQRLTDTIAEFGRFVGDIETNFLTGGKTIGATIAGLV